MITKSLAHYKIIEKLGAGGMGEVYLAQDSRLDRRVALKMLPPQFAADPEHLARLRREAKAIAALNHPNIVTIFSVEDEQDITFFTMEWIEGQRLDSFTSANSPVTLSQMLAIAIPVVDALGAAHRNGICHRDLKPANIMIDAEHRPRILDFGLAQQNPITGGNKAEQLTVSFEASGKIAGSIPYMSPEQCRGSKLDCRTDIFSVGVVLYEMASGKRPFCADSPAEIISSILRDHPAPIRQARPDLPVSFENIVNRCLEKEPSSRYQTAEELRADLENVRDASSASDHSPPSSIAVLPFADLSREKDQDYFCEGMAEELNNALTHVENLRVASRMSTFQFTSHAGDSKTLGTQLGVDVLLEGSVRKSGDRIRITAQLVNVADGFHLWSEKYDRRLEDIFAVQDEIAGNIVKALKITIDPSLQARVDKQPTIDVGAYDYFLRGRQYFFRQSKQDNLFAQQMFMRAIEADPDFARAYAGLADSCSYYYKHFCRDATVMDRADQASKRALQIDPQSAEAHTSRGLVLFLQERRPEAEMEFEAAVRLAPRVFESYYLYAHACLMWNELEKSVSLFEQASALRPEDYQAPMLRACALRGLNQIDRANDAYRHGLRVAQRHLELNPDDPRARYLGAGALILLGECERGAKWAEIAAKLDPDNSLTQYNLAAIYAALGDHDLAFDHLNRAVDLGMDYKRAFLADPDLEPLRNDPRFAAVLQRMS